MNHTLTLSSSVGSTPITLQGDERSVCIQAEHILREMWKHGQPVAVHIEGVSPRIVEYLNDVAEEIISEPRLIRESAPSITPN